MGRPKRCASRPKPYIPYNPPSTTTTTEEPIDYTGYIVIPESGAPCPGITTTTTTTTTPEPFVGCKSYQISGTNYVVKYTDCQDQIEKIQFYCSDELICASGSAPEILAIYGTAIVIDLESPCEPISTTFGPI